MLNAPVRDNISKDEPELITRVADGDRAAFRVLFDRHASQVQTLCRRLLGNNDDAQEVAQDVFVSLWQKAATLRGESRLSTWLHRVAVNKAINFRKSGKLFSRFRQILSIDTEELDLAEQLPAPESSRPDRQREKQRARVDLAELMATLPERQRDVYLLHKLEGLSYQEVCRELGLTQAAVESLMHRAKAGLHKAMLKKATALRKKS